VAEKPKKKVVRVETDASNPPKKPTWKPTPEAKGKATKFRLLAALLWLLAIGGEAFAIFWVLKQDPINMVILIGSIVVIGILAISGSILWKKANRADPAPKSDAARFFFQNQLGAIITIIAFLPLIIWIFRSKDMDSKQKGIAGGIGIAVALVAMFFGADFNPPSVEQYDDETAVVVAITGEDLVYWTKSGRVYHLCEEASDVQRESQDGIIYSGTVGDAHADGKERLTLKVDQEIAQCGFEPLDDDADAEDDEPAVEPSDEA